MSTKVLRLGPGMELPLDAATDAFGILGRRGAGKSNAGVVLAEELFDAGVPWVAVDPKGDWWGVRASADGKGSGLPVPVFGGLHGDIPLEPTAGQLVADLLVDSNLTAVLDVSRMSGGEMGKFLIAFFHRLFDRHQAEPHVRHVVLEEAHRYIPQVVPGPQAALKEASAKIVLEGRSFGLGASVLSQRSARIHKDVLTQVSNLIPMWTMSPQDLGAIRDWVKEQDVGAELLASLPNMKPGEAWLWSPEHGTKQFRFRQRRTFDSGATPKVGQSVRTPSTLADIDLGAVKEAMAETLERAKENDPAELRKRVAVAGRAEAEARAEVERLQRELERVLERKSERVEVPVILPVAAEAFAKSSEVFRENAQAILDALARVSQGEMPSSELAESVARHPATTAPVAPVAPSVPPAARRLTVVPDQPSDAKPPPGIRRMLDALAARHPMRLTKAQVATLARMKGGGRSRSGTFDTYWSRMRTSGWIEEAGGLVGITDAGLAHASISPGQRPADPVEMWRGVLGDGSGARRMFDVLVEAHPSALTKDELAEAVGLARSGTFDTYLSRLRSNGIVAVDRDGVQASADLFV